MSQQLILTDNAKNNNQQQQQNHQNQQPLYNKLDQAKPTGQMMPSDQQMQQQISSKLSPRLMQQAHQQANQQNITSTPLSNDQNGIAIRQGVGGGFGAVRYNPSNGMQMKGSGEFNNQQSSSVVTKLGNVIVGGTGSVTSDPPPSNGVPHGPTVGDLLQIHGHHSTGLKVQGRKSAGQTSIWNSNQKYVSKNDSMKLPRGVNQTQDGINEFKQKVNMMLENQLYLDQNTPNRNINKQVADQKYSNKMNSGGAVAAHNWSSQNMNINAFYNGHSKQHDPSQYAIDQIAALQNQQQHASQPSKFQSMQLDHKNQINKAGVNMNTKFLSNRQNGQMQSNDSNIIPSSQLFRPPNNGQPATGGTGRSVLDTYSKEASRDSHSMHGRGDFKRPNVHADQQLDGNLDYHQMNKNGGLFSPVHHGNMLQKLRMDSKKQSISKDDPSSIQMRDFPGEGSLSTAVVDAVGGQKGGTVPPNANQSLSLQGESRRNIQKNNIRDVMKISEQEKLSKTPNYNTYSLNNHKQQQRRKLLFEYGLEKKLQNQAQQQSQVQQKYEEDVNAKRQEAGQGVDKQHPSRHYNQQAANDAISRNNGYLKLYELLDKLKTINIDYLEANELEQLRFFSAQYQYYLSQYQEQQVQQKLNKQISQVSEAQNARSSNLSQYGPQNPTMQDDQKGSIQQILLNNSPQKTEKNKESLQNDIYMSQEKFIKNEKNLSQQRLHKSKQRDLEKETSENAASPSKTTDSLMGIPVIGLHGEKSPNSNTPVKFGPNEQQFLRLSQDKNILDSGLQDAQKVPTALDDQHFTISESNMKEIQVNNNNQKMVLSQNGQNQSKKSLQISNDLNQANDVLQYGNNNNIMSHGSSASRKSLKRNSSNNQFQKVGANTLNTKRNGNMMYQQTGEENKDVLQAIASNVLGSSSTDVQASNRIYNNDLSTTAGSSSKNVQPGSHQSMMNQYPIAASNQQQFAMSTAQQQQSFIDASGRICQQLGLGGFNYAQPNMSFAPPQITINDIKAMTTAQKINIFRHLQRKEKTKFINIQQQKMAKMGIDIDDHRKTSRNKNSLDQNPQGRFGKQSNGKFLDIVKRQAYNTAGGQGSHSRSANHASHQVQEQAKRQWTQDMKAFGIFQQNELWQFGQMSEAQQKQILICNLQQGKFQGILDEQYAIMQQQALQLKQNINLQQQLQLQQRNFLSNNTKDGEISQSHSEVTSSAMPKRHANYGSALSALDTFQQVENKFDKKNLDPRESSPGGSPLKNFDQDAGLDDSEIQFLKQQQENAKTSLSSIDKTINMQVKNINEQNMQIVIENGSQDRKLITSPIHGSEAPKTEPLSKLNSLKTHDIEQSLHHFKDKNDYDVFLAQKQENPTDLYFRSSNSKTFEMKMNDDYSDSNKNGALSGDFKKGSEIDENILRVVRKPLNSQQANPVQNRYEESKSQFETYLINILEKYQDKTIGPDPRLNARMQARMGIENLLPNFPRHLTNGDGKNPNYYQQQHLGIQHTYQGSTLQSNIQTATNKEKSKIGVPANQKLDKNGKPIQLNAVQTAQNRNKLRLEKEKSGANGNLAPDSTKNKGKDKDGKDKKEDEKEGDDSGEKGEDETKGDGEEVKEEPKKPRYFPPRRIPNPFEKAAQEQEQFLQARKDALAKYSNISKNRFKQDESQPLKFVIRPGNNSKLITRVFEVSGRIEARDDGDIQFPGWESADDHFDSLYNFKWKPTSGGIKYDLIGKHGLKQLVNHVKGHGQLTTKDNLFLNMKQYYESQKLNIFDVVPLTIVLDYLKDDVGDRVDHFLGIMKVIDRNIGEDYETINKKLYENQLSKEKSTRTPYKITDCCHNKLNLWLLKPTGFNRGIGIHIFQTFDQLREIMFQHYGIGRGARDKTSIFQTHNQNHQRDVVQTEEEKKQRIQNFTFVIQKLIEKPRLYLGRKFDIRAWVLYNSADGKVYLFKEPYVRTSSKEYKEFDVNAPDEEQLFTQLTNNAIQKTGEEYGKFEEGNIISIQQLFEHIAQEPMVPQVEGKSHEELQTAFRTSMIKLIQDSMRSVKGKFLSQRFTFELLGYDFILDEHMNTILIEVNTNPCLEESNKLLKHLLPRMLDNLFCITVDPLFSPSANEHHYLKPIDYKYKSKFPLPASVFNPESSSSTSAHAGYKDDENLWEHVYTMEQ